MKESIVKQTCKELEINQRELAEMLEVSPNTISNWAKGDLDTVNKILLESLIYKSKFLDLQSLLNFRIK